MPPPRKAGDGRATNWSHYAKMSTNMTTETKGILLIVGGYIATMAAAAFTTFAIMILTKPHSCSDFGRALVTLWGTLAALFLASVAVVRVVAWKIVAGATGRWAILIVYGALLLVSYVAIAFGLMVAFNC